MGKDAIPPSVRRSFYIEFSSSWFPASLKGSSHLSGAQNRTAQKLAGHSDLHGFKPHPGAAALGQR